MTFQYWFMLPIAVGIGSMVRAAGVVGAIFSYLFLIQDPGDVIL